MLKNVLNYLAGVINRIRGGYTLQIVDEVPENVAKGRLYLVGENAAYWQCVLKCPCGCLQDIQLPLSQESRPRWRVSGKSSAPSLIPSVRRRVGCRSHFVLKHGRVIWCRD